MGQIIGALIREVIWLALWRPGRNPGICGRLVLLYGPYRSHARFTVTTFRMFDEELFQNHKKTPLTEPESYVESQMPSLPFFYATLCLRDAATATVFVDFSSLN